MIHAKLKELGIELPNPTTPIASYIPAKIQDNLLFISGQLPFRNGNLLSVGPLQYESDIEIGKICAEQCFINSLSAASTIINLDKIKGVLKLNVYVASKETFVYQHLVANGASDLSYKIFEEAGKHTRSAIGVVSLPLNASIEIDVIFQL